MKRRKKRKSIDEGDFMQKLFKREPDTYNKQNILCYK
jgi:hypothetical protein